MRVLLYAAKPYCCHLHLQRSTTGRMRNRKGLLSGGGKDQGVGGPIMFADVAGVDEAKEELEEIVVSEAATKIKPQTAKSDLLHACSTYLHLRSKFVSVSLQNLQKTHVKAMTLCFCHTYSI